MAIQQNAMQDFLDSEPVTHNHGTISKLGLSKRSANQLKNWCYNNDIPCIDGKELHCTLLFSRKPVEKLCRFDGSRILVRAGIKGWKKLGTALTLSLDAPHAEHIHRLMIEQGGTHDFPDYIAHTTVSYGWESDELPDNIPDFVMEFDRLDVGPIDPRYAEKSINRLSQQG